MRKLLSLWLMALLPWVAMAESAIYYRPFPSGFAATKIEAVRALITPQMKAESAQWANDPHIRELIEMSRALDVFVYDGMRLVRTRGVLVTNGAIDEEAFGRTMMYYNVNHQEAKAWLLASRVLQLTGFKEGVSIVVLEEDMIATAEDLLWRMQTYFSKDQAVRFMPRFAWSMGYLKGFQEMAGQPHAIAPVVGEDAGTKGLHKEGLTTRTLPLGRHK